MRMKKERIIDFRHAPDINQTCIGFADDVHKTIVREDGSLNYNFDKQSFAEMTQMEFFMPKRVLSDRDGNLGFRHRITPRFRHRDQFVERSQHFHNAKWALVTTTETYRHTTFEWDAFAWKDDQGTRADIIHWKLRVSDDFGYARSNVVLHVQGDWNTAPRIRYSPVYKTNGEETETVIDDQLLDHYLHAGDTWEGVFAIVLEGDLYADQLTLEWARKAKAETIEYWENLTPFKNTFRIPDQQIMDMLEACARNILQAREVHDGTYVYQVGPTIYRGLWMVDGFFLLDAAQMMGHRTECVHGLMAIAKRARHDGSIRILPMHNKETGIAIASLVYHCELLGDDERLQEYWPVIRRALRHIQTLRRETKELGEAYPLQGMFAPAFGDGGIGGPEPEFTTALWTLVGLKFAARAGKRLGLKDYELFENEYEDLYAALRAAIDKHMRTTARGTPYIPMSLYDNPYYYPQTGTWALAHAIYPGEIFAPDDPVVTNFLRLLDEVDDEQGLPVHTGWLKHLAVWSYSAMFYAQNFLYAGDKEKAVDYLYAFANHASASRVWREEHSLTGTHAAEINGDMPHNWGSAEFIRLVRNLIVMERLGRLEIFRGLPAEWLPEKGRELILENTPTRFGKVTVELIRLEENRYKLRLEVSEPHVQPEKTVLHWPGEIAEADVSLIEAAPGVWELPDGTRSLQATLRWR